MVPNPIRTSSPIQKQTRNPRLPRASTFPIAERQALVPRLNLPSHLNLFTNQTLQPPTPMSNFSTATAGMSFAGPSMSFPSLLPSPASPNAGSAALSLLLPPTPPPPMSDLPFSPLNSAGLRRNELQLPSSPLHHNYTFESDLNSLLQALTPSSDSQQTPNPEVPNLTHQQYKFDPMASPTSVPTTQSFLPESRNVTNFVPETPISFPPANNCIGTSVSAPTNVPAPMSISTPVSVPASLPPTYSVSLPAMSSTSLPVTTLPSIPEEIPKDPGSARYPYPSSLPTNYSVSVSREAPNNNFPPIGNVNLPTEFVSATLNATGVNTRSPNYAQLQNGNENNLGTVGAPPLKQARVPAQDLTPAGAPQRRVRGRRSSPNSTLVCPECNQLYSRRDNLRAHLRGIHHGDKPYKCNNCGERFRWASTLRSHEATNKCRRDGATPRRRGRARGTSSTPSPQVSTPVSTSNFAAAVISSHTDEQILTERPAAPVSRPIETLPQLNQLQDVGNVSNFPAWEEGNTVGQGGKKHSSVERPSTEFIDYARQNVSMEPQLDSANPLVLSAPWSELCRVFEDAQDGNGLSTER